VTVRSKVCVCCRSIVSIAGSNPAGSTNTKLEVFVGFVGDDPITPSRYTYREARVPNGVRQPRSEMGY